MLCLLVLCWTGDAGALTLNSNKPLVVVHSSKTPPLAYVGVNGEQKGMVVEYWRMWSRESGIPITIVLTTWPETLRMVRDGEADIQGGLYFSEDREKFLDFASSYFNLDTAVFVRKGLGINSMDEMRGHIVGVLESGYSEHFLKKNYPELQRKAYPSASGMVEDAVSGKLDAMLSECTTITYLLGEKGKLRSFNMLKPLYSRSMRPAVAKGRADLLALVKESMANIPAKERERVFSRWTIPTSSSGSWLLGILAVLLAFVGVMLFLSFYRGRSVR